MRKKQRSEDQMRSCKGKGKVRYAQKPFFSSGYKKRLTEIWQALLWRYLNLVFQKERSGYDGRRLKVKVLPGTGCQVLF